MDSHKEKSRSSCLPKQKQIKAVSSKAIQTRDMNKSPQGGSIKKTTKEALLMLNRHYLATVEAKGAWAGVYIF